MKTEIIAITDRSGSMATTAAEVIGGYNAFLQAQRGQPGKARMTFVQFDHEYELVYEGVKMKDAPDLSGETYQPRGTTALLDAIGKTITGQGRRIKDSGWGEQVVVCIITDGLENASKEFTREQVQQMIGDAEKDGWKFIYLAANQDAFAEARAFGMNNAVVRNYVATREGTTSAYADVTMSVNAARVGNWQANQ